MVKVGHFSGGLVDDPSLVHGLCYSLT